MVSLLLGWVLWPAIICHIYPKPDTYGNFEAYFCAQNNQLLIILATKLRRGEILLQL